MATIYLFGKWAEPARNLQVKICHKHNQTHEKSSKTLHVHHVSHIDLHWASRSHCRYIEVAYGLQLQPYFEPPSNPTVLAKVNETPTRVLGLLGKGQGDPGRDAKSRGGCVLTTALGGHCSDSCLISREWGWLDPKVSIEGHSFIPG